MFRIILLSGIFIFTAQAVFALSDKTDEYKFDLKIMGYPFDNNGLSEAIIQNNNEAVSLFIKAGIDVNQTDAEGMTALYRAIKQKDAEAIKILTDAGAEMKIAGIFSDSEKATQEEKQLPENIPDETKEIKDPPQAEKTSVTDVKTSLFEDLCNAVKDNNPEQIKLLSENTEILNLLSTEGLAPLHYAVFNNQPAAAHLLLNAGAEVNVRTDDGLTPLDIAVLNGEETIAKLLTESGGGLSKQLASELMHFGCKLTYDDYFDIYDGDIDDIFKAMQAIDEKIESSK